MYYNTTGQQGISLKNAAKQTVNQDEIVLNTFQKIEAPLSPSDVLDHSFSDNTPITSIRRSINTLTKRGLLVKTETTKTGMYGKPEHQWKLAQ